MEMTTSFEKVCVDGNQKSGYITSGGGGTVQGRNPKQLYTWDVKKTVKWYEQKNYQTQLVNAGFLVAINSIIHGTGIFTYIIVVFYGKVGKYLPVPWMVLDRIHTRGAYSLLVTCEAFPPEVLLNGGQVQHQRRRERLSQRTAQPAEEAKCPRLKRNKTWWT